ncbi:MAG: hypothetical protein ABIG85_03645 [Chloroflexota bacterium]
MAGYAGARPRTGVLGRRVAVPSGETRADPRVGAGQRRRVRGGVVSRARRRSGRTGILIAGIVLTFGLGFVSLAQTIRVSASAVEQDRILAERQIQLAEQEQLLSDLYRLGREPAIRKQALDAGLGQLVDPLIVPAR